MTAPRLHGTCGRRRRGMTLVELLASVAILTAISAALLAVFSSTIRTRRKIDETLSAVERAAGAADLFIRDLEQIHVYDTRAYLLVEQQEVAGKKVTSVAFPCLTPIRVSEDLREKPGLIEVAYLVGPDTRQEGALSVFRRELPIETNRAAKEIRTSSQGLVLLADGLTEFAVEFLAFPSTDPAKPPPEFVEKWSSGFGAEKMPAAMRIRITAGGVGEAPPMAMVRTVRFPIAAVDSEMLQPQIDKALKNAK